MIEPVNANNLDQLLPLIAEYQTFYGAQDINQAKNREFFSQFGEGKPSGCQFLYRIGGEVAAFATVYFTYSSTITSKVAVMNDLYTLPGFRGQGIAKQLIEHCYQYGIEQGAVRLQWLTAQTNTQAQALYDVIGAAKSNWVFYSYIPKS